MSRSVSNPTGPLIPQHDGHTPPSGAHRLHRGGDRRFRRQGQCRRAWDLGDQRLECRTDGPAGLQSTARGNLLTLARCEHVEFVQGSVLLPREDARDRRRGRLRLRDDCATPRAAASSPVSWRGRGARPRALVPSGIVAAATRARRRDSRSAAPFPAAPPAATPAAGARTQRTSLSTAIGSSSPGSVNVSTRRSPTARTLGVARNTPPSPMFLVVPAYSSWSALTSTWTSNSVRPALLFRSDMRSPRRQPHRTLARLRRARRVIATRSLARFRRLTSHDPIPPGQDGTSTARRARLRAAGALETECSTPRRRRRSRSQRADTGRCWAVGQSAVRGADATGGHPIRRTDLTGQTGEASSPGTKLRQQTVPPGQSAGTLQRSSRLLAMLGDEVLRVDAPHAGGNLRDAADLSGVAGGRTREHGIGSAVLMSPGRREVALVRTPGPAPAASEPVPNKQIASIRNDN